MKHSPFAFFRKHQRVGMVILTVLAMFAFVFLDQTMRGNGGSHASQVAVKLKGGNLTHEQIGNLIGQRVAANRFIQAAAEAIMEDYPKDPDAQNAAKSLIQQQFGQDFPGQADSESNVLWGHIMRQEAKRMGMSVSDYNVEAYLNRILRRMVSADRYQDILRKIKVSEKQLYDVFREEILAKMATRALFPQASQTPEQYWEYYKRLKIQQNLEIAALPVKEFTSSIADPGPRELEALFNEYKTHYAGDPPEYWKPGFRQPTRVKVQYLTASFLDIEERVKAGKDKYTKPVTDKEIVEYYEKNKNTLYKELEIDDPKDEASKDGASKKDDQPLDPGIAPEKSLKTEPAKPADGKPEAKPADAKPEAKPADAKPEAKPADAKPEAKPEAKTEKPADKPEAKPEAKPEVKAEAKPEAKPEEKPADKPAEGAEKKSCGEDTPATDKPATDKPATDKPAADKPAADKPTEDKPAAEKPAADKPATDKPADKPAADKAESKPAAEKPATEKPTTEKPAGGKPAADKPATDKPATDKPAADKPEGDTKAEVKPPKFKPLTDDLKNEIRDGLENARALESLKKMGEDARAQLDQDQIKYAFGPSISGQTVYVDFNENGQPDPDEPSVESDKKLDSDVTKIPQELQDSLNEATFAIAKEEMTKVGKKLGMQYAETDLISFRDLEDNPKLRSLSKVVGVNENPFQPTEAGKIRQELFGSESRFHPRVGKDDEERLYVYWKIQHIKEHIAKFTDPGIKEEVLNAYKLLKAYPEAQKRAEELVKAAQGKKNLQEAFKGLKVSDEDKSLDLEVHETGDFTWMSLGVPSPQMMQASQVKLSHVEWTDDKIDEEFMQVACEDLAVGEVGFAPNRDHSTIFIIRVANRGAKNGEDMAKLRETFMKEQLFDNFPAGLDPSLRQYFPPPAYAQMALQENGMLYYQWLETLKKKYEVTWSDELKNN